MDVVKRAAHIFPELIIGVAALTGKNTLFSQEERVDLVKAAVVNLPNVTVQPFEGLLVEYARSQDASVIIRGLRAVSDFEYEFQMALMNRELAPACETVFLMPSPGYSSVSSTMIREIARLGGDIQAFVPPELCDEVQKRFAGEVA